jgi:hypothetical protein
MRHIYGLHEGVDREYCAAHGIHYCDKANPFQWAKQVGEAYHPDAREIPDSKFDRWNPAHVVILECPYCGLSAGVPKGMQPMHFAEA